MSDLPSRHKLQTLASRVWGESDRPDSPYGNFVFLLPAPDFKDTTGHWHNVSLDERREGGDAIVISLADFASRVVEIEYPQYVPEDRELLTLGLSAEVGHIILAEQAARQVGSR